MKHLSKVLAVVVLLTLVSVSLSRGAFAQEAPPTDSPDDASGIFLPLVSSTSGSATEVTSSAAQGEWSVYNQPSWGITIGYPADWKVSVPDFAAQAAAPKGLPSVYQHTVNQQYLQSVGYSVTLFSPSTSALKNNQIDITLESYKLSPGGDLKMYVNLLHDLHALENPLASTTTFREVDSAALKASVVDGLPSGFDQVYRTVLENSLNRIETVWIAKGELVYSIRTYGQQPELLSTLDNVISRIDFAANEQQLKASIPFNGDQQLIQQQINALQPVAEPACGIECRDQQEMQASAQPVAASETDTVQAAATTVSSNRKALPPNWRTPVYPPSNLSSYNVRCGSQYHGGADEFAVDAGTPIGTPVYAMVGGYVSRSDMDNTGYGNLVLIQTSAINMAAESRTYYHAYAHLNSRNVSVGQTVSQGALIGYSGNTTGPTTTGDAHLHFHIRDSSYNPVDASPVLGFTPDLRYPRPPYDFQDCGKIEKYNVAPQIIESVAFTARIQPRSNHSWWCVNAIGGATNECYMEAAPNNGANISTSYSTLSPEMRYSTYLIPPANPTVHYVWVCGYGGSSSDDSMHMGVGNNALSSLSNMDGFGASWYWRSQRGSQRPSFSGGLGSTTVNVWMKEDGLRIGRILTTTSSTYNPNGKIRCGSY